jgi:general secretion pathway protein D
MPTRVCITVCTIALVFATMHGHVFAQATSESVSLKSYKIGTQELSRLSSRLQANLAKTDPDAEVYVQVKQNKIIVRGSAATQARAAKFIAEDGAPAVAAKPQEKRPQVAKTQPKPSKPKVDANVVQASFDDLIPSQVKLRYSTANQFCDRLQRAFGRTASISSKNGDSVEVQLRVDGEMTRGITLDSATNSVQLPHDARFKKFWWQTVQAIDREGTKEDPQSAILKLNKADPAKVKRAIEALQASMRRRQIEGEPGDEEMAEEEDPNGPRIVTEITDDGEGAVGSVQIEVLEDMIIVRGRKEDVERVKAIIAEIEKQTRENKPEIEIIPLNHVQDRVLADYVNQIYTDIYGTRQGRVTILPLKRPNAILLAGRAENVASAKELVAKLDQPNDSAAQYKVIHLKHISAADAESTINRYLTTQPGGQPAVQGQNNAATLSGLDNRAVIVSEARINALLIFAGARDIAEIEKLVEQIDVQELTSENVIRFFRLRNALSDDLKATLDEAINGQVSGRSASTTGTQANPTAGLTSGPGAAPTSSGTSGANRNAGLQFLQVDEQGQRLIKSGVLNDIQISSDPRSNTLVVTGPANTMELIAALIDQLDTLAQADAAIKVFTVVNGDAAALVDTLQQLFGQTTQGQAAGGGNTVAIATPGAEESTLVSLRFGFDERTNSIIVTGAARDLDTVERLLIRLDESDVRRRRTTVYRLLNAPAEDVALALQEFLQNQRTLNQLAPTLQSPIEQLDREILVVAEPVSNSLLVSATLRYYDEMKGVIEELDRRPPMVVVQTMIAEVNLGENNEFGVELGLQDALLYRRGINGTTATPGFGFAGQPLPSTNATANALATAPAVAGQALLGNFGLGRSNTGLGYGGMVLSASSQSVSALVRALQQNRQLQVISRPQIQTLDNQLGRVQVGASVPYPTNVNVTTFGTSTSVTLTDVGIILEVRPRTSPDGLIVMEVGAEKSQLGPEAEGIAISVTANGTVRAPQILRTRAVTVVSARTGQTVILGGLITKSRENETRRVPYLSDIPVAGALFRYDRAVETKTELLIFLTPYIVRNEDDINFINAQEAARMNWCLSDIADAHGQVPGMGGEGPWGQQQTPVIFPDEDPTGMKTVPPGNKLPPGNVPQLKSSSRTVPKKSALLDEGKKGAVIVPMGPVSADQEEPLTLETRRPADNSQFKFDQQ